MLALTLAVVGCGDGDGTETTETEPPATAPSEEPTASTEAPSPDETAAEGGESVTVDAAYIPVSAAAALHLGVNEGFFEAEGLDVTITEAEPPSMIPSVLSGDIDFAFLNAPAVMVARENGLAVQGVAAASKNSRERGDHLR